MGTAAARRIKPRTNKTATGVATLNRHAGHPHALSQDFRILTAQRLHRVGDEFLGFW